LSCAEKLAIRGDGRACNDEIYSEELSMTDHGSSPCLVLARHQEWGLPKRRRRPLTFRLLTALASFWRTTIDSDAERLSARLRRDAGLPAKDETLAPGEAFVLEMRRLER
jgi:hypothetical protein